MTMLNYDGTTKYVWNPYSLAELQGFLSREQRPGVSVLDDYLQCVATGGQCKQPTNDVFKRQQVVTRAVQC